MALPKGIEWAEGQAGRAGDAPGCTVVPAVDPTRFPGGLLLNQRRDAAPMLALALWAFKLLAAAGVLDHPSSSLGDNCGAGMTCLTCRLGTLKLQWEGMGFLPSLCARVTYPNIFTLEFWVFSVFTSRQLAELD